MPYYQLLLETTPSCASAISETLWAGREAFRPRLCVGWLILSLQGASGLQTSPSPHCFASSSYVSKDREPQTRLCRRVQSTFKPPRSSAQVTKKCLRFTDSKFFFFKMRKFKDNISSRCLFQHINSGDCFSKPRSCRDTIEVFEFTGKFLFWGCAWQLGAITACPRPHTLETSDHTGRERPPEVGGWPP